MITFMRRTPAWRRWIIVVWVTLLMAGLASPVRAQGGTLISVQPPASQVPVGSDLLIELYVTNGVDVNAFDVTLTYDPNVLTLNSWAHGGYLKNLAVVSEVNQPGSLRLAATQLASPPVSGDGVLLKLNFRATAAGTSPVTIAKAEFASSTGAKIEPERVDGTVTAVSAPTFTPTATVTRTPTATATATRTPTVAPTSTWTLVPTATWTPFVAPTGTPEPGVTAAAATALPGAGATVTVAETQADPGAAGTEIAAEVATTPGTGETGAALTGEPTPSEVAAPVSAGWLAGLLWGALIAGIAAIGVMFVIILRRRMRRPQETQKDKDLLL
jgi:hypothetical protein